MQQVEELRYLILAAQREGNRLLAESLRPLGLTPAQAEVLTALASYEPLTLRALGDRLVCETGSPSRLVATLVQSGSVDRRPDADDARATRLQLTAAGRDVVGRVSVIEADLYRQMLALLPEDAELGQIVSMLWSLVERRPAGMALARRIGSRGPVAAPADPSMAARASGG